MQRRGGGLRSPFFFLAGIWYDQERNCSDEGDYNENNVSSGLARLGLRVDGLVLSRN